MRTGVDTIIIHIRWFEVVTELYPWIFMFPDGQYPLDGLPKAIRLTFLAPLQLKLYWYALTLISDEIIPLTV